MSFSGKIKEELAEHVAKARHCNLAELADKLFIECIMYMTVEHIGEGFAFLIPAILSVITKNRVMGEDYFSAVIVHLCIGFYPNKAFFVKFAFF